MRGRREEKTLPVSAGLIAFGLASIAWAPWLYALATQRAAGFYTHGVTAILLLVAGMLGLYALAKREGGLLGLIALAALLLFPPFLFMYHFREIW